MNKNLITQLRDAKQQGLTEGVWQGIQLGINLAIIAYYNVLGIGKKRYARITPEITRLIKEIRADEDPIQAEKHINDCFERMR